MIEINVLFSTKTAKMTFIEYDGPSRSRNASTPVSFTFCCFRLCRISSPAMPYIRMSGPPGKPELEITESEL